MELAYTICENLPWTAPNGQPRVHECLPLLEQLAAAGLIKVPAKRAHGAYRPARLRAEALPAPDVVARLGEVRPVTVEPVPPDEQAVWDATLAKYHPLGFQRAFGAHQRYWIRGTVSGEQVILGALLFAAAARHVAVRDAYLGWTPEEQQRCRYRVVANSRYLILPGVQVPHLASHALAQALQRLPEDWRLRYGYRPVVVETFVSPPWRGTCYRAANWLYLGQTTGRGRQDRQYAQGGTPRAVFVYPLQRDWQQALLATGSSPPEQDVAGEQEQHEEDMAMRTASQALNELNAARVQQRYQALVPYLDEKQRRLLAGAEALVAGSGGVEQVAGWLGISPTTVRRGLRELQNPESIQPEQVRRPGGGRRATTEEDPTLLPDLETLVAPSTRGDPQSPLRWTCKSTRKLAAELQARGHQVGHTLVAELLHRAGYSLQANRKTLEGGGSPAEREERDAQFEHISERVKEFQAQGQPVISVDCKKKELVGQYKNAGHEWQPEKQPEQVQVYDFIDELGKVAPYGVYDVTKNSAWVSVGTDHDTAAFAVASIRTWWQLMGHETYREATRLLITADGCGSNGARNRLWKVLLQELADETGLEIAVCHLPPGTSKWNRIEHRLFSHITQNWRARPLTSHEVILNLIANTTTSTGLTVRAGLDTNAYPTGIKVPDEAMTDLNLSRDDFHGGWNYTLRPRPQKSG